MKEPYLTYMEELRVMVGEVLTPDLLRPDWRIRATGEHHTYGHCYVAAEALWHLIGGAHSRFVPRYAKYYDESDKMNCTHWWLYSIDDDFIYDPTKEQYTYCNLTPPYHYNNTSGFLTKFASKRAMKVIDRVLGKYDGVQLMKVREKCKANSIEDIFTRRLY